MRRVVGSVEVGLVAVPAGRAGQAVVVVDVARSALLAGVESHQREPGSRVVERGAAPIGRSVTAGTILREVGRLVGRIVGVVEIGLVTVPAGPARQTVVVVDMALHALQADVGAGQSEPGGRVVEVGAGPVEGRGSVAQGAVQRESSGFVRRVGGSVIVRQVAVRAGRGAQAVVVVEVAPGALLGGVESDQRKSSGGVVEDGAIPIRRGVTARTILWEVGRLMRRIVGVVVIGLVTAPAGTARQIVVVAHVALGALNGRMRAGQRKPGSRVIECGAGPVEG